MVQGLGFRVPFGYDGGLKNFACRLRGLGFRGLGFRVLTSYFNAQRNFFPIS